MKEIYSLVLEQLLEEQESVGLFLETETPVGARFAFSIYLASAGMGEYHFCNL